MVLFVAGNAIYNKASFPYSTFGAVMLGLWIGWLYDYMEEKNSKKEKIENQSIELFCQRCNKMQDVIYTGFSINSDNHEEQKEEKKFMNIIDSEIKLFRCKGCGKALWASITTISNAIKITIQEQEDDLS